ncbi:MAG: HYR domain-containing protein [Flavobacteriaceae bacterium]|nr:HYR domain-containing protein [Flavobacteriaceae bacterium]
MKTAHQIVLCILLTLVFSNSSAQSLDWLISTTEGDAVFSDVVVDDLNQKVYAVGTFRGNNVGAYQFVSASNPTNLGSSNSFSNGDEIAVLVAFNLDGELLWEAASADNTSCGFTSVDVLPNGSIVVGGYHQTSFEIQGTSGSAIIPNLDGNGRLDAFFAVYDQDGAILHAEAFGGDGDDTVTALAVSSDGFLVSTMSDGDADDFSASNLEDDHVYRLCKYDLDYNLQWSFSAADKTSLVFNDYEDKYADLASNGDTFFFIGFNPQGNLQFDDAFGNETSLNDLPGFGTQDIIVMSISNEGLVNWTQLVDQTTGSLSYGYGIDADCNQVYITGAVHYNTIQPVVFPGGISISSSAHDNIFLAALNRETGLANWAKAFETSGGNHDDIGLGLVTDDKGSIFFTGTYSEDLFFDGYVLEHFYGRELFMLVYSDAGNLLFGGSINSQGDDIGYGIDISLDGELFVAGKTGQGGTIFETELATSSENAILINYNIPTYTSTTCCLAANVSNLPSDELLAGDENCEAAVPDYVSEMVLSAPCSNAVITQNPLPGTIINGTSIVTFNLSDDQGVNRTWNIEIGVEDITPPSATHNLPLVFELNNDCEFVVPDLSTYLSINPDCSPVSITQTPAVGDVLNIGTHSIEFSLSDDSGNTALISHNFDVEDNTNPVIISCPSDVTLSGTCSAFLPDFSLSPELIVDENCSFNVGQWPGVGAEITEDDLIVLTVSDQSGNTAFCTFNAAFTPIPSLDLVCTDFGASINLNSACSFNMPSFSSLVSVNASCGQSYTIEQFPPSGTTITGADDLELIFQVQDNYGNVETCSSVLEFNDVTPPNYTCPSSHTVFRDAACNFAYPNWVEVLNATDACGVSVIVNNVSVISDYLQQIQLGISDGSNQSSCVVNLNILDFIFPAVEPIEAQLIPRLSNCNGLVPDLSPLVVGTDNCTDADELFITQLPLPGTEITESQLASVFVSDQGGNTSTIEVALDLAENLAPSIVCPEDRTAQIIFPNCLFELPDYSAEILVVDECDFSISQSPDPGTLLPIGDHTLSFVVSDAGGLSTSCSFILSVLNLEAPIVSVLPEPSVEIGEMCFYVFDDESILFQFEDCDPNPLVRSFSPPLGTELGLGTHEIEMTIVDSYGNTEVVSNFIHVEDNTAPSMLCPNEPIDIALSASCEPQFPDWIPLLAANDHCAVSVSSEDITYVSDTYLLINIEITDGSNNSSCAFNANLVDLTPPEIVSCVENQSLELGALCEIELPDYRSLLLASDACSSLENLMMQQSPAPGSMINENQTVSIVITDEAGNSSSCEFDLVLADNQAPDLICPLSLPGVHLDDACQYVMEDFTTAAIATDNCDLQSVTQSIAPGTILSEGLYQITFTAEDTFGNQSSCLSSFNVLDNAAPEMTWIAELSFQSSIDCNYAIAEVQDYISAYDCNDLSFSMSPEEGTLLPAGIHLITIIAEDAFGNESELETQIEVLPTNELTIESCASIPDQVMNDCSFIMPDYTSEISWSGICSEGISISQLPAAGTEFTEEQVIEVLFELNGTFGSFAACSSSFEITSALPSLSCEDISIAAVDCGAPLPDLDFFGFDLPDCANLSIILSPSSGTYLSLGTHLISASVSDNEGNTSSCSFNVTIEDQSAPQLDCQAFDLPLIETNCGYLIEDFTASIPADDNCSANLIITQNPINQLVGGGSHEITFVISDGSNEITCTKILEVIDNQAPVFQEYNDISIELSNANECGASVNYPLPTLEDPCGEEEIILVEGLASGSFFPIGEHLIVFEAIDGNGNSNLISFTISVIDLAAPVLIEPISVELCQGPVNYTLPEVMSDCGLVEVVQVNHPELSSGDVFPVGTTIIEFMATDGAGNSTSVFWEVNILESSSAAWSELPATICSSEGVLNLNDYYLGDEEPSWNWGVAGVLNLGNYVGQILNITLSVGEGTCSADSTQSIHIIGPPNIDAGESGDVCGLSTTLLGATNANTFWWEGDEGLSLFEEGLSCEVTASEIGVYELSFFATNGTCTSRDDIILNFVEDLGELSVVNNITTIEPVINISANYTGNGDVLWTTNSSSSISDPNSLAIEISNMDEGLNLFFIDINNGVCDRIQDTVYVNNIMFDIPSGFSPNGDGANDTFEIIALSRYETKELQIFNRWGQNVYTNLNYDNSWDGTSDGVELIDDTYFYVLLLDNKEFTGYVVIRR